MDRKPFRIIFMGTPEFAVPSLAALLEHSFTVVAVVTSPDKPAGRGLKLAEPAVKRFAITRNLQILQPENLKDPGFISELEELKPDLHIIVGFRKLPKEVWALPQYGTFNLHASLLPQYRGAAPINWSIINGEKYTGVTTFFIDEEIDTGKIIFQEEVEIDDKENAGDLHDKLAVIGARLVVKTTRAISDNNYPQVDQNKLLENIRGELKRAPKIFREHCRIDWSMDPERVYNFIRGLSPYPAAWTEVINHSGEKFILKVYSSKKYLSSHQEKNGTISTDGKTYLRVAVSEGYIGILELQIEGKSRMGISEFLRGFRMAGCRMDSL